MKSLRGVAWVSWIPCLILGAVLLILCPGCQLADAIATGPKLSERVVEIAGATGKTLLATYAPKETKFDVKGGVNDPRYYAKVFVGAGTYIDILMGLDGADLRFGIDSVGEGLEADDQLRREALELIGSGALTEQERLKLLTEAVVRWIDRAAVTAPAADTSSPSP